MSDSGKTVGAVIAAILGVAIVAVIVSKNAQTSAVLQAAAQGFGGIVATAVSPVTGSGGFTAFSGGGTSGGPLGGGSSGGGGGLASILGNFGAGGGGVGGIGNIGGLGDIGSLFA